MPPSLTYSLKNSRLLSPRSKTSKHAKDGTIIIKNGWNYVCKTIEPGENLGFVFPHAIWKKNIQHCSSKDFDGGVVLELGKTKEVIVMKRKNEVNFCAHMNLYSLRDICNCELNDNSQIIATDYIAEGETLSCFLGNFKQCNTKTDTDINNLWYEGNEDIIFTDLMDNEDLFNTI